MAVKIQKYAQVILENKFVFSHKFLKCKHLWKHLFVWISVLTVKIPSWQPCPVISQSNAIRVYHRYDLEDDMFSKKLSHFGITTNKIQETFNHIRPIGLTWMRPSTNYHTSFQPGNFIILIGCRLSFLFMTFMNNEQRYLKTSQRVTKLAHFQDVSIGSFD